jgi:PKD repeat protein
MQFAARPVIGTVGLITVAWAVSGSGCLPVPGSGGTVGGIGGATNLPPIAVLTKSISGGVAPLQIAFSSDQSTDDGLIVSREWDFGDGSTSLEVSPLHSFADNGTFTVTLTLTDNNGSRGVVTTEIIVTRAPTAVLSVDRTIAPSAPATINFSSAGSFDPDGEIVSVRWDFDDGTREDAVEIPHTFTLPGTFRVRLTVTDDVGITATDEVLIQVGTAQPAIAFRAPPDDLKSLVASQEAEVWVQAIFAVESGVPYTIRAGLDTDMDPSNDSDIQLDTDPPNGNDLNITAAAGLQLSNVAALNGAAVPPGAYRIWAEIDTDRTGPTRVYAKTVLTVIPALRDAIDLNTPVVTLIDDIVDVAVDPDQRRQIFDLGPVAVNDQLFVSFIRPPDFVPTFEPGGRPYSLMLLDSNLNIFAWFQPGFILFTEQSRLVVARDTEHMYVVTEGGLSIHARIARAANFATPRGQRVFVNFAGTGDLNPIQVADLLPMVIPPFDAQDINATWGGAQTQTIKNAVMDRLRALYADYDVTFFSDAELAGDPNLVLNPPYQTLHVGGRDIFDPFSFGIADYIDPRNETATGGGLVFAIAIGRFYNTSADTTGLAIGNLAGHELGHLLGLRHTDSLTDLMGVESVDTNPALAFESALVSESEQFNGLPAIGIQNAPMLLEDTIGLAP